MKKIKNYSNLPNLKSKIAFWVAGAGIIISMGCQSSKQDANENISTDQVITANDKDILFSADYVSDKEHSKVTWQGEVLGKQQNGTIDFSRGQLGLGRGEILGGTFKLDLESVSASKESSSGSGSYYVEQMKSKDFLNVQSYPEAELEILSVSRLPEGAITEIDGLRSTHNVEATLSFRGVVKKITFPAQIEMIEDGVVAKTNQVEINPEEWGANNQKAGLKDRMKLAFTITANRV